MRATVEYIDYEKGFGFIATDEIPSRSLFIHARFFGPCAGQSTRGIYSPEFMTLSRGDRVTVGRIVDTPKGLRAEDVRVVWRRGIATLKRAGDTAPAG